MVGPETGGARFGHSVIEHKEAGVITWLNRVLGNQVFWKIKVKLSCEYGHHFLPSTLLSSKKS